MRRSRRIGILAATALLVSPWIQVPATALETDQFYAWTRPLDDARGALNAKVNYEIGRVLAEAEAPRADGRKTCRRLRARIARSVRLFIFHDLELWLVNSPLVDRIPRSPDEELEYREAYLYHASPPLDVVTWMPPSPTIEIDGIRLGTDKVTHFTSEGWLYFRQYDKLTRHGFEPDEATRRVIDRGLLIERTLLGGAASGVLSLADLEANYQGMRFFLDLCDGDPPRLQYDGTGWRLDPPFDFADYVSPEWDESWHPSIFGESRWRRVVPVLRTHCAEQDDPRVVARREAYAERDRETPTERRISMLIEAGKLRDPERYRIDRLCAEDEP